MSLLLEAFNSVSFLQGKRGSITYFCALPVSCTCP